MNAFSLLVEAQKQKYKLPALPADRSDDSGSSTQIHDFVRKLQRSEVVDDVTRTLYALEGRTVPAPLQMRCEASMRGYQWKKKYAGMGVRELGRLKQLEDENQRLKQLVADLSLDKHILQEVLAKRG
jgi:hypothetical protein